MRYVSSLVQIMLKISRELEDGEKQWVIVWSMKSEEGGIGPVKPACMVFSEDESFSYDTTKCAIF